MSGSVNCDFEEVQNLETMKVLDSTILRNSYTHTNYVIRRNRQFTKCETRGILNPIIRKPNSEKVTNPRFVGNAKSTTFTEHRIAEMHKTKKRRFPMLAKSANPVNSNQQKWPHTFHPESSTTEQLTDSETFRTLGIQRIPHSPNPANSKNHDF